MMPNIVMVIAVLLGLSYAVMAWLAYRHIDISRRSLELNILVFPFWWPFLDMYDEFGKRLCFYGKINFVVVAAAYYFAFNAYWNMQT